MKKALLYVATAILLGTVTMLTPVMLLEYDRYGQPTFLARAASKYSPSETETLGGGEALGRAVSPSNLLSAGLILIPSFVLALGVSIYLKKRIL